MGLIAKDTGEGDFSLAPQGTHLAICYMVADLGLQESNFAGDKKVKHQCYVRWEMPHERVEWTTPEGQPKSGPMTIGKFYTVSLHEKSALRKDLEAWRGRAFTDEELKGFDLFNLLGVGCQVTITHKDSGGKVRDNVGGIAGWPKGVPKATATENPVIKYSDDDRSQYSELPDWIKKKLSEQADPNTPPPGQAGDPGATLDDEIPF